MGRGPITQRKPGILYRLISKVPPDAPPYIVTLALELDKILIKLWGQLNNSLPSIHGATHRGGRDDISGDQIPSPIVPGAPGSPGTPQNGFAPIDHEHPNTLDDPIDTSDITGSPSPPFATLRQQLDWLNSRASGGDPALKPVKAMLYR